MKGRPKVFKMQEGDSRPVTRATAARIAAGVREGGTDPYDERMDTNPPGDVSVRSGSVNPDTVPSVLAGGGANDPYDDEESDPGYFAPMPRQVSGTYGDPKALTHEAVQRIVAKETKESQRGLTIPKLDHKQVEYQEWVVRFYSYAAGRGFAAALEYSPNLPESDSGVLSTKYMSPDQLLAMERHRIANRVAAAQLIQAMVTSSDLSIVYKNRSKDWPGGLAYKIMEDLEDKYSPRDVLTRAEAYQELNDVSMNKYDDPTTLFEQITKVQNWFDSDKDRLREDELIGIVLARAPPNYKAVLTTEKTRLGNRLKVSDLEKVMRTQYRMNKKYRKEKDRDSEFKEKKKRNRELSLNGVSTKESNGDGKGAKPKCDHCGKKGHTADKCWDDPKNKHKIPEWLKKKRAAREVNAATVSDDGAEIQLTKISYVVDCRSYADVVKANLNPVVQDRKKSVELVSVEPMCCKSTSRKGLTVKFDSEICVVNVGNRKKEDVSILRDPECFIVDSGATSHSVNTEHGLMNIRDSEKYETIVGNGSRLSTTVLADLPVVAYDTNNRVQCKAVLKDVMFSPESQFNILSTGRLLKKGFQLSASDTDGYVFTKGETKLVCNIKVQTKLGMLHCIRLKRESETEVLSAGLTLMEAHELLGHWDEERTRSVSKSLGLEVKPGQFQVCEACALGKARQKNVKRPLVKTTEVVEDAEVAQPLVVRKPWNKSGEVHGRVYLDISSVKKKKGFPMPTKPHWRIIVDEHTGKKHSHFFPTKDAMVEPTCELLYGWADAGKPVKAIRMDNAGENKLLAKRLKSSDWKLNPAIEYTARNTPQHNHLAEVGFSTLANRGRAVMIAAKVPLELRYLCNRKAFEHVTKLDGLVPVDIDGVTKSRDEHYYGLKSRWANPKYLKTWGEAGVVTVKSKATAKLADRGVTCMFAGYSNDHDGDVYDMLDWNTKSILTTRDVTFLNRMYFTEDLPDEPDSDDDDDDDDGQGESGLQDHQTSSDEIDYDSDDDDVPGLLDPEEEEADVDEDYDSDDETVPGMPGLVSRSAIDDDDSDDEEEVDDGRTVDDGYSGGRKTRFGRKVKVPEHLDDYVLSATSDVSAAEISAVGAGIGGGFQHTSELKPMKYEEAMKVDPVGWSKAVDEEYNRMQEHGVFEAVPKSEVPKGSKILSSTWAMKLKANGTKRARINARGYEQVPGEHYNKTGVAAPVVNEATINIVLILIVLGNLYCELNDVNGAFLTGTFSQGEKLYMKVPKGFEKYYGGEVVLLLLKTIYGLIQSAYEYWRKLLSVFIKIGFARSNADPCAYYKWKDGKLQIWTSWVDDLMAAGDKKQVIESREALKGDFKLDELGELKEYIGCKVELNREERYVKLTQPVLIQSLVDEFDIPERKAPSTPAPPNSILEDGDVKLNDEMHSDYRKGVGKLIHLTKFSRPEVGNAVRDLATKGSFPCQSNYEGMIRAMHYTVGTKDRGLVLKPFGEWDGTANFEFTIHGISDSDFAKHPNKKSVSGRAAFLNGAPYTRKSVGEPIVATSVMVAELISAAMVVQDMLFGKGFLESLGLRVKLPMKLMLDNKGGVDFLNNWNMSTATRAVAVRFAWLRELREDGTIEVEWISTENNHVDLFTKNLDKSTFEKHTAMFCAD